MAPEQVGKGQGALDEGERGLRGTLLLATALVFVQLGLGAAMRHRHAGLAVPDFPLAYGRVWPQTDAASIQHYNQQRIEVVAAHPIARADVLLHMVHRLGACAVVVAVILAFTRARRQLAPGQAMRRGTALWLGLVLTQFVLGAITVWTDKAADIATAHVAVGSLILLTGGLLCAVAWRRVPEEAPVASAASAAEARPFTPGDPLSAPVS